jgi:glycosyltransferase involved in cell wall biosynthesis
LSAKKAGKPLVISPIHHSVKEVKRFDDDYVFDLRRIAKILFRDQHNRDTFKNVYRSFFNPSKAGPTIKSILIGLKKMHTKTLQMSDMVLVQTQAEAADLKETYCVDFSWRKIPNGVGAVFLNPEILKNKLDFENYIICVGRIEPRKNQLNVISAVDKFRKAHDIDTKLVLVGSKYGERHFEFKYLINKALKNHSWVVHIPAVPYTQMPSYYKFAKVGVSASWFETTGLTSLEALFCGTNAVASGERAKEYLGDLASYCDPGDISSIEKAIEKEYFAQRPVLSDNIKKEFTWENASVKTLEVYNELLKDLK